MIGMGPLFLVALGNQKVVTGREDLIVPVRPQRV